MMIFSVKKRNIFCTLRVVLSVLLCQSLWGMEEIQAGMNTLSLSSSVWTPTYNFCERSEDCAQNPYEESMQYSGRGDEAMRGWSSSERSFHRQGMFNSPLDFHGTLATLEQLPHTQSMRPEMRVCASSAWHNRTTYMHGKNVEFRREGYAYQGVRASDGAHWRGAFQPFDQRSYVGDGFSGMSMRDLHALHESFVPPLRKGGAPGASVLEVNAWRMSSESHPPRDYFLGASFSDMDVWRASLNASSHRGSAPDILKPEPIGASERRVTSNNDAALSEASACLAPQDDLVCNVEGSVLWSCIYSPISKENPHTRFQEDIGFESSVNAVRCEEKRNKRENSSEQSSLVKMSASLDEEDILRSAVEESDSQVVKTGKSSDVVCVGVSKASAQKRQITREREIFVRSRKASDSFRKNDVSAKALDVLSPSYSDLRAQETLRDVGDKKEKVASEKTYCERVMIKNRFVGFKLDGVEYNSPYADNIFFPQGVCENAYKKLQSVIFSKEKSCLEFLGMCQHKNRCFTRKAFYLTQDFLSRGRKMLIEDFKMTLPNAHVCSLMPSGPPLIGDFESNGVDVRMLLLTSDSDCGHKEPFFGVEHIQWNPKRPIVICADIFHQIHMALAYHKIKYMVGLSTPIDITFSYCVLRDECRKNHCTAMDPNPVSLEHHCNFSEWFLSEVTREDSQHIRVWIEKNSVGHPRVSGPLDHKEPKRKFWSQRHVDELKQKWESIIKGDTITLKYLCDLDANLIAVPSDPGLFLPYSMKSVEAFPRYGAVVFTMPDGWPYSKKIWFNAQYMMFKMLRDAGKEWICCFDEKNDKTGKQHKMRRKLNLKKHDSPDIYACAVGIPLELSLEERACAIPQVTQWLSKYKKCFSKDRNVKCFVHAERAAFGEKGFSMGPPFLLGGDVRNVDIPLKLHKKVVS